MTGAGAPFFVSRKDAKTRRRRSEASTLIFATWRLCVIIFMALRAEGKSYSLRPQRHRVKPKKLAASLTRSGTHW